MSKFLTQEEIEKEIKKRGYMLMDKYINSSIKMTLKDKEGFLYSITWDNFKHNKNPMKFYKNNPYTIQNIKLWMKVNAVGYKLLSEKYINNHDKLLFQCPKGHEFSMCWRDFKQGHRCNICAGRCVTTDNCISTTDSWMIKYFKNKEDVYIHTSQSNQKVSVVCPNCGKEKEMIISSIYKHKSICCTCSDGTSYPEKFTMELLNQLNVKYVTQLSKTLFSWCDKYKYDFYLHDYNCIIETHGGQHYKQSTRGRSLQEEQENDKLKKELALNNGISNYVELDCRYSKLEYIKNSILNSELNNLFNLNNIDWVQCEEFALSNKVKQVCDYWREHNEINNEDLTTTDISRIFNLSVTTIQRYLNKGVKLGWCNYDNTKGIQKKNKGGKPVEIFKNSKSLGVFESCSELERQSEKLFGIKLNNRKIASVCRGERPHHKGYTFKYKIK